VKRLNGFLAFGVLLASTELLGAQTRLTLSSIIPGTENVQSVYNGDFQFQGQAFTNAHPYPVGWTRQADVFADAGTNMVPTDNGVVAKALVNNAAPVGMFQRTLGLAPNTDYVLSAYLWNFGDAANHVTTVVDFNDAPQEPQITLNYSDTQAATGQFVYRSFNTGLTGSNITLRVFYDGFTGTGAAASYFPLAAQWDNIAITKATDFLPPQPSGTAGNLRPQVTILGPADGASLVFPVAPAALPITVSATDPDGSVPMVEFYAGAAKLGQATTNPFGFVWTNPASGSYQITAIATDNQGATTVSAPVNIFVTVPPEPTVLQITRAGTNFLLLWPTSATSVSLLLASNVPPAPRWKPSLNPVVVSNNLNTLTVSNSGAQSYFVLGQTVDPSTLDRKLMMGYQGWFLCPGDGSPVGSWVHWFRNNNPVATNATVDFWPDISELQTDELFATSMTLPDGSAARVYSAFNQKTVLRHFKWMKDYNLDGVFLQRFSSELSSSSFFAVRNQVLANVRIGAETYGRVFAVMYDISGQPASTLVSTLTNDWNYLVSTLQVTNSPRYIRHHGKPVVAIWGFGFTDRPGTPSDAQTVINYFKSVGATVMGGVPTYWRTLTADSQTNSAWASVYRSFDIISPWAVGRYGTTTDADNFKINLILPDLVDTRSHGIDYMPVIFPGFSWHNLNAGPLNQIPRNGGTFYWRQAYNAVTAQCTMIYGAMFDEMDEGTAMLKMAPTPAQLPAQGTFVPLNIDGQLLPSDWYLRMADQASRMLRGDIPALPQIPITP
jgi:hypothetical protein